MADDKPLKEPDKDGNANVEEETALENGADETLSPEQRKKEKRRITKNLLVVSSAFLFLFTAFQSLQNLQSSLNTADGLGLASLSVVYAALIPSCIFVPPYLIGRIGCKWTLVISMVAYVLYTAANYYATWWTLIPASVLVGISAAPLWASKCAYLTTTGIRYSQLSSETQDAVVTRYFGIFFFVFQSGQIWGNLISSLILQKGEVEDFRPDAGEVCGARFCTDPSPVGGNATDEQAGPERHLVLTMLSVYLACGVCAILLLIFLLDRLTGSLSRKKDEETGFNLLIATLKHLKDRRMQLVVPITIFSGIEQAYVFGDFTKAFVTCTLGIHRVGLVMICFGVSDAIFSFVLGRLTKYTGRIPVFISGLVTHLTAIIVMLAWKPDGNMQWVFYVLALLQGYCDAVWQTQINAMYGVFFHDNQEPAFSNYRLWESLGFMVAFAYANYACVTVKLGILLVLLIIGITGYFVAELLQRNMVREAERETELLSPALYPLQIASDEMGEAYTTSLKKQ